jgi:hypothetical protein
LFEQMKLSIRRIGRCLRRPRRAPRRQVEERLRRYGESFAAPAEAREAGLKRVLAEFERAEQERGG